MGIEKNQTYKADNLLYLVIWLGLSLFMGYHHEPFSDEAQSYLIARDVSLLDLIKDVARTEGAPLLWFLWLKVLIFCGLTYKYICFSSIIPNFIGVCLFVTQAPFTKVIRYLFPLTYFVFFQYNIVARSYSLLLLFITLVAIYYPKRKDYPWLYLAILILFSQITVYTLILATGIFFMGLLEDWQKKQIRYKILAVYITYLLLVVAMLFPTSENQYFLHLSTGWFIIGIKTIRTISSGLITYGGYDLDKPFFLFIGAMYFTCILVELGKQYCKEVILLLLPVILFSCYANKLWHGGIIILTGMFIFWQDPKKKLTRDLKVLLSIFFLVQIIWSIHAFIKDKNEPYSAGRDVYQFLSAHNIPNNQVLRAHFNTTSICPYYEEKDCTRWNWEIYKFTKSISQEEIKNYKVYIINQAGYKTTSKQWDEIQRTSSYKLKIFPSGHFVAFYDASSDENLYVYYRKDIDE